MSLLKCAFAPSASNRSLALPNVCPPGNLRRNELSSIVRPNHQTVLSNTQRMFDLVSCPRNSRSIAGGQLAVFQGGPSWTGGKAPISESYGSSEQRGKTVI